MKKQMLILRFVAGQPEYSENNTHYIELGRNLSEEDVKVGRSVVVFGLCDCGKVVSVDRSAATGR